MRRRRPVSRKSSVSPEVEWIPEANVEGSSSTENEAIMEVLVRRVPSVSWKLTSMFRENWDK